MDIKDVIRLSGISELGTYDTDISETWLAILRNAGVNERPVLILWESASKSRPVFMGELLSRAGSKILIIERDDARKIVKNAGEYLEEMSLWGRRD